MSDLVWKLVDAADWQASEEWFSGSDVDRRDGYIHMSTSSQVPETAARHYRGRTGLLLLGIDPAALAQELVWEPSRGGELFPHLYGPLPHAAAVLLRRLAVTDEGHMQFEDGAAGWP